MFIDCWLVIIVEKGRGYNNKLAQIWYPPAFVVSLAWNLNYLFFHGILTNTKGHEPLRLVEIALFGQKITRVELVRLLELTRIPMHTPLRTGHECILRYGKTC